MATQPQHKILLTIPSNTNTLSVSLDVIKGLRSDQRIIFVTLQKTAEFLRGHFSQNGIPINNTVFIDCITSFFKPASPQQNCCFISAPYELDRISEAIRSNLLPNSVIVFDSLSVLLNYSSGFPMEINGISPYLFLHFQIKIGWLFMKRPVKTFVRKSKPSKFHLSH